MSQAHDHVCELGQTTSFIHQWRLTYRKAQHKSIRQMRIFVHTYSSAPNSTQGGLMGIIAAWLHAPDSVAKPHLPPPCSLTTPYEFIN